jgi:hypothetical protein
VAYLLIAFVVLPIFIPLAVITVEPTRGRKHMMAPFAVLGAVIAVTLFAAMGRDPVRVKLAPYHLSYGIRVSHGFPIVAMYVVAVCGPEHNDCSAYTADAGWQGSGVFRECPRLS